MKLATWTCDGCGLKTETKDVMPPTWAMLTMARSKGFGSPVNHSQTHDLCERCDQVMQSTSLLTILSAWRELHGPKEIKKEELFDLDSTHRRGTL